MGEIYEFPINGRNKKTENIAETVRHIRHEEKEAIGSISEEKRNFMMKLKEENPQFEDSEEYNRYHSEFQKISNRALADMLNNNSEEEIRKNPERFAAAFDVLFE